MKRPKKTFPKSPGHMSKGTPFDLPDPQYDAKAFEDLIKNRGLRWTHEKATPCPNVVDIETHQHDPNCKVCENGMLFFDPREVHGIFQQNKLERMYEIQGVWDVGEAVATFSAYQDGEDGTPGTGDPIDMQHFDKLTCLDYSFRFQELIEHSPLGVDRLRYPALSVEMLATKDKVYTVDEDFVIDENGMIKWIAKDKPGFDHVAERGEIYTISYCARPVFYIVQLVHEIRATKGWDPTKPDDTSAVRLPQQVFIRRDYLFNHPGDDEGQGETRFPRGSGVQTPQ